MSHSPWVVRQVALETQQNAFYESVLGSSYWYFMKIESDSKVSQ
ncbi:hypothetical protein LEP1GSC198_1416 [Leptospira kirschneri str. JB]|nr:hypothetical protein LEP1GSC198_1416 [Leptospira kirschneri str. JB]